MTLTDPPLSRTRTDLEGAQRFIFTVADWNFYQQVSRLMKGTGASVTFHKGKLELATISFLHERRP